MDILQSWKAIEDGRQLLRKGLLGVFDLSRVELWVEGQWSALGAIEGMMGKAEMDDDDDDDVLRIRVILNPDRICVGRRR